GTAVVGIEHRAAAGGDDHIALRGELGEQLRLAAAKAGLALEIEDGLDRHPAAALEFAVDVDELASQQSRQPPADRGLAGTGHADEEDGAIEAPTRGALDGFGGILAHDDRAFGYRKARGPAQRPA